MRKLVQVSICLFVSISLLAQKKPLDHTVYDGWQSIGERAIRISCTCDHRTGERIDDVANRIGRYDGADHEPNQDLGVERNALGRPGRR